MNKKSKIIIITAVAIVFVVLALGVLYWGLQPVQEESVSLEKLNKKLGDKYCMPSELPFEGDVECSIIYVRANMGVVLTRFELNPKKSTGYSIRIKDINREIYIETGDSVAINDETAQNLLKANYNNREINYYIDTTTDKTLTVLFEINDNTYYLSAKYNNDVNSEALQSDMEYILAQMIK